MTGPSPAPGSRGELAQRVAEAVDSIPGARRSSGPGVVIATQFRGGSVAGVRLRDGEIDIHIVAEQLDVLRIADAVSAAVATALTGSDQDRRVVVNVDDIDLGEGTPAGSEPADAGVPPAVVWPSVAGRNR